MIKHVIGIGLAVGIISLSFGIAGATPKTDSNNYWSQSAPACSPTDVNIQSDAYLITGGTVKHKGSSLQQINLMCGVERNSGASNPSALFIAYNDPDGTATTYTIQATLWARNRTTGSLSTIGTTVSSNSNTDTSDTQWASTFSHTFNFNTNHYYVYASVLRSSSSTAPFLSGVSLGSCSNC